MKIAIVGVGNCAASLIEGIQFYRDTGETNGLMHPEVGGYLVGDVEVAAAFDVDREKVGVDVAEAVRAGRNNIDPLVDAVRPLGVTVLPGPRLDGIGRTYSDAIRLADRVDSAHIGDPVVAALRDVDVVVNYLPVGSQHATEFYANCAIEAGCAFVNCIPVFLASNAGWAERFRAAGLPLLGDDIKSQFGATIMHRIMTSEIVSRGCRTDRTYQLNFGGNMDFLNMKADERLDSKKVSKTRSILSMQPGLKEEDVHISPSDYVPWLGDTKVALIRVEGRVWGNVPFEVDVQMRVPDSANSAGVVIDAIRLAKVALDSGVAGAIGEPTSYLFKSPPVQLRDDLALRAFDAFVAEHAKPALV